MDSKRIHLKTHLGQYLLKFAEVLEA